MSTPNASFPSNSQASTAASLGAAQTSANFTPGPNSALSAGGTTADSSFQSTIGVVLTELALLQSDPTNGSFLQGTANSNASGTSALQTQQWLALYALTNLMNPLLSQTSDAAGFSATPSAASPSILNALANAGLTASDSGASSTQQAASQSSFTPDIESAIKTAAQNYGLPVNLLHAVVEQESGGNPHAVSSVGAVGLMQLMPATAESLGVQNPLDPVQNLNGGAKYLRSLLDRYDGNVKLALAAYNAGPGAVDRYGGVPPYSETQNYVQSISSRLSE